MSTVDRMKEARGAIFVEELRSAFAQKRPKTVQVTTVGSERVVATKSVSANDTPERIATWAQVAAQNDLVENNLGVTRTGWQRFTIYLDEDTSFLFQIFPESDPYQSLMLEHHRQLIDHNENKEQFYVETVPKIITALGDTIRNLTDDRNRERERAGQLEERWLKLQDMYLSVAEKKHIHDLEVKQLEGKEKRKDQATDRLFSVVDKTLEVGGAAILKKIEEKMGPDTLDRFASLLDEDQQKDLARLIVAAQRRAAAQAAQANDNAETKGEPKQ